ncbi:MAG: glycosyltransferase, partial [Gemmatimonadaceae bacterium]|nr:glycosyltransferase [Acetobacteraceae bacterium]
MFSVLIPSFNHRPYLVECVVSALRSTLVTEVLIVDDGSSDRSPGLFPLLRDLDTRVRTLPNPGGENRGAHARLNQLVDAASNEWVAPLNSDDRFVAGRFEAVRHVAAADTADLMFGDLVLIDGQGSRLGLRNAVQHNEVPWPAAWDMDDLVRTGCWLPPLLLQNVAATTTNMVFTKRLHAALGGFRDLRYCHDWDFMIRAALHGRVRYVPAMLAQYRIHAGNTIKEAAPDVAWEPRRMLGAIVADTPQLRDDPAMMQILAHNHYAAPRGHPTLTVVVPSPLARGLLQREVVEAGLPVCLVGSLDMVPPESPYLYQPGPAAAEALCLNDLRQVLLALSVRAYDAVLLLRTTSDEGAGLADILVLRRGAAGRWRSGAIRRMRLYPLDPAEPDGDAGP